MFRTFEITAKWQNVGYARRSYRLISLNQPINVNDNMANTRNLQKSSWEQASTLRQFLSANLLDKLSKFSTNYAFRRLALNISIRKLFSFVCQFGRHSQSFQIFVRFGGKTDVKVEAWLELGALLQEIPVLPLCILTIIDCIKLTLRRIFFCRRAAPFCYSCIFLFIGFRLLCDFCDLRNGSCYFGGFGRFYQ